MPNGGFEIINQSRRFSLKNHIAEGVIIAPFFYRRLWNRRLLCTRSRCFSYGRNRCPAGTVWLSWQPNLLQLQKSFKNYCGRILCSFSIQHLTGASPHRCFFVPFRGIAGQAPSLRAKLARSLRRACATHFPRLSFPTALRSSAISPRPKWTEVI